MTPIVAQHFVDGVVPDRFDLAGLRILANSFVLHDLLGAQGVAAVHQVDLAGDVGQVQRFLDRGIAAADHGDVLVLVEEAVAGGAGGHAAPLERSSDGMPRYLAVAPVAMISASQV